MMTKPHVLSIFFMFALLVIEFPEVLEETPSDEESEKPPFHLALNGNNGNNEND